jgi:hypothetical protein
MREAPVSGPAGRIEGPVSGGSRGWAFGGAGTDLAAVGYTEDEWFLDGDAASYRISPGMQAGFDGRWRTEKTDVVVPFRTRLLVRRPLDPSRFNGTVLVNWNNVTAGMDIVQGETPGLFADGFAHVGVTTQAVGVHGFTAAPAGLCAWDAERYGSLSIPTDDASYDIFTQAARLVGPHRQGELDPMGGLRVERVVAVGGSQSAARLHTYLNAVAPLERVFDAYLLQVHFGGGTPLNMGGAGPMPDMMALGAEPYTLRTFATRLRTDLGVPIVVFNSETETTQYAEVRQPDDDWFRLWEVAGSAHAGGATAALNVKMVRDLGEAGLFAAALTAGGPPPNDLDTSPVLDALVHHLQRWLTDGVPMPSMPRIEVEGDRAVIVRDRHGIARGGIRLPDVEVPLATLTAETTGQGLGSLSGSRLGFDAATIAALYPNEADYLERYDASIDACVSTGCVLVRDADRLRAAVRSRPLPF